MKIVAVVILAVLSIQVTHCEKFEVEVDVDEVVNDVGKEFVSIKFSADIFRKDWRKMDTSAKRLESLAKELKPSVLRIGGSAAQFIIFKADGAGDETGKEQTNFTLTGKDWESMYNFAKKVGWEMMFDFNNLLRKGDKWDTTNAKEFLKYSQNKDFSIPYFQVGNEPYAYNRKFGINYSGATMVDDMKTLRKLLSGFTNYKHSKIVGPDTGMNKKVHTDFVKDFFKHGGAEMVSALGYHHYYVSSMTSSIKTMTNITVLNSMKDVLNTANVLLKSCNVRLPVWLTAASSLASGGLQNVCDRYVAGFMWLDTLGLSALYGVKTVIRQTFMGGSYALVSDDFIPRPDYFLTVLYKRLVKGPVFKVKTSTDEVRAYASCANTDYYKKGALTVYILNLKHEKVTVNFQDYPGKKYDLYLLEPGDKHGLTSEYVSMNGKRLVMDDEELPPFPPLKTSSIVFPSNTFGFIVIPDANVKAC